MTSRTTPVGILVIALASLFAVGCSAETGAVFEALLDPARAPASPSEADVVADAAVEGTDAATWWPHPDGYAMVLPAGWSGVAVDRAQTGAFIDAIAASYPVLADRIQSVLGSTESRVSAIATDPGADDLGPVLLVLAQSTEGKGAHAVKTHVREQIAGLPGLSGKPYRNDVTLPTAKGVRFDYTIDDPDLGPLQIRSYLFRFGSHVYLVNLVAAEDAAEDVAAIFDAIADSLRFGV